jgi:cytosine/adenosine deaminase-related metal-dependent hydrolase
MTPIELLHEIGMLRTTLNIGHGNFIAEGDNLNYSGGRDLQLMGDHHCSISHCPINIARRGRVLNDWKSYRDAGVNISIGSDTYPRDMIMNMRTASLMGKIIGRDYFKAPASQVFEAATVGGAKSIDRDDLGRLREGAFADIVIIDFMARNPLRYGPVRDPIKSLVECGVSDDVDTVIVDGRVCMENGVIPGVDMHRLAAEAQAAGEAVWETLHEWDPRGRTAQDASPWSFPVSVAGSE